ncbi:MAG: hypothetical protein Q7U20_05440 [Caulobacter sp.]|nr:hypothetical protein [Caulobacter sp.]
MSVSITSDVVEVTKLITAMISGLAWPVVILTISLFFRSYIAEIIGRASGIEWGNFKVAFEQRLETAEARANLIPATDPALEQNDDPQAPLENLPPDYLVLDAWRSVEAELTNLAIRTGHSVTRGRSPLYLIRLLRSRGVIDPQTAALLDDLRALRNAAVHPESGSPISREQALRFRELSELVLPRLRQLPNQAP